MISVIIISYNTSALLRQCLEKLYENGPNAEMEVFVVDNNSSDDSTKMVERQFSQVRLIINKQNMGFAAANNQAWSLCAGKYILLLNSDAFVQPRAIENSIAFMDAHPRCGLCGGKLLNQDGSLEPSARRFPNVLSKFFAISGLRARFPHSILFSRHEFGNFDHNSTMQVDWVPGTFALCRREMLEKTGLFDERFYIYYEETDLCLRAKKLGWEIYFIPDAEIIHVGGASSKTRQDLQFDAGASQMIKFRMRSEWLYFRKNFGLGALLANSGVELAWHSLRWLVNSIPGRADGKAKSGVSFAIIKELLSSIRDTNYGKMCPPIPW